MTLALEGFLDDLPVPLIECPLSRLAGVKSIDDETEIMPRSGWSSNSRPPPSRHNYELGISRITPTSA
jgi:hypothetical protein